MTLRLNLGHYLKEHDITAYRLAQEVQGHIAPNTVYSLARKPARRIDLGTVGELLKALARLRGQPVELTDIVEETPDEPTTNLTHLQANPATPAYNPNPNRKFKYSGKGVKITGGPSVEQIIAEERGRTLP